MGYQLGMPSLKLNNVGRRSKHCGSFAGVAMEALEERKGRDPDIDPERSHLNVFEGFRSAAELMAYSEQHVQELSQGKRKIRADAVVMCSTLIKPPAAMMNALSLEDQKRFLDDAYEKVAEVVGEDNVKSKAFHMDEIGGHLHVFWEPMTADGRLCAKELHNIKFFGRMNREMPEHLRSRGWDIDDCHCYDAAKEELEKNEDLAQRKQHGIASVPFKAMMEREVTKLQEVKDVLEGEKALLEGENLVLEQEVAQLQEQLRQGQEALAIASERRKDQEARHDELTRLIHEQEDALQLIQTYDEYLQEADAIDRDMDLLETAAKELPAATKLFRGAAAEVWLQRMQQILRDIQRMIEAGIRRLLIYEKSYAVEQRRSEPAQERFVSLSEQIFGAVAGRARTGEKTPEKAPGDRQERT